MEPRLLEPLQRAWGGNPSQIHQHSSLATDLFPSVTSMWPRARCEPGSCSNPAGTLLESRWNTAGIPLETSRNPAGIPLEPCTSFWGLYSQFTDSALRVLSRVSRRERLSLCSAGIWLSRRTGMPKILTSSKLLTPVCLCVENHSSFPCGHNFQRRDRSLWQQCSTMI